MASPAVKAAMRILAAGNPDWPRRRHQPASGFTLLELLVVLAIVAMASVGIGFAMRDGTLIRLEREAQRLSALLEAARSRSQVNGLPVRWRVTAEGYRFEGLPPSGRPQDDLPQAWLDPDTSASVDTPGLAGAARQAIVSDQPEALLLGPDPIIEPQAIWLTSRSEPAKRVRLATDGVRPFALQAAPP